MFDLLKHILGGQNQFATGGLLLMMIGSLGVFLRALPGRLWGWLVAQATMTVTVSDDDEAFTWVKEWFLEQEFLKRIRNVDLDSSLRGAEVALIPAPERTGFSEVADLSSCRFIELRTPRVEANAASSRLRSRPSAEIS